MPHRHIFYTNGLRRIFDFVLESEGRNGWVKLRLIRVEWEGGTPLEIHYDPELHDDTIDLLGRLFSARGIHLDGVMRYSLVNAFDQRGYLRLEYVE